MFTGATIQRPLKNRGDYHARDTGDSGEILR